MVKNFELPRGVNVAIGITALHDYLPYATFFPILPDVHLLGSLSVDLRRSASNFGLSALGIKKVRIPLSKF